MAIIRIIAIVVGDETTQFYREDGSTIDLPSTDIRIPNMVASATPVIAAGMVADVDFSAENEYQKFEEKTGGLIKMFRVLKDKVKHIFLPPPAPQTIGIVPVVPADADPIELTEVVPDVPAPVELVELGPEAAAKVAKMTAATDAILANATPVSSDSYTEDETTAEHTIVAVIEDKATGNRTVIPGMENLKDHMALATKLGSTVGVENFLKRISTVISKRGHSIDDLLRFMLKNDMPIADDGCLVAYKTLNRRGNKQDEYQDIHSGNVVQRVGSKVFMAESMVDPNRRNECSNGLHVARRAYVGGFRGGVMVLIKVAPEDAIAVPQYDGNKMRVCGYHIVGNVPEVDHETVYGNQPIGKDTPTAKLVGAVIKGDHIGIIELVEIGGAKGGNLKVTKLGSEAADKVALRDAAELTKKAEPVASIDDSSNGVAVSKADAKGMAADIAAAKFEGGTTKAGQARMLFNAGKLAELLTFKKEAKKSWEKLGFNHVEIEKIAGTADTAENLSDLVNLTQVPTETITTADLNPRKDGQPTTSHKVPVTPPEQRESNIVADKKEVPKMDGTRAEVARKLFDKAAGGDKTSWGHLWTHKKECKKSWEILGFTPKEIERIKTNKPDWV